MKLLPLTLLAWIPLVACSLERVPTAQTVAAGEAFRLSPGQSAVLASAGLRIGFEGIVADSRCPRGEQCVRAGDARAKVWLQQGTGPRQTVELVGPAASGQPQLASMQAMGYRLTFLGLDPEAVSGRTIASSDYRLTLDVRPAAADEAAR